MLIPRIPATRSGEELHFTLEANCSSEFHTWALGRGPRSKTYMQSYKSMTASIDVQGLMQGSELQSVTKLGSISLDRVKNAPQHFLAAGEQKVMSLPEFWRLYKDTLKPQMYLLRDIQPCRLQKRARALSTRPTEWHRAGHKKSPVDSPPPLSSCS